MRPQARARHVLGHVPGTRQGPSTQDNFIVSPGRERGREREGGEKDRESERDRTSEREREQDMPGRAGGGLAAPAPPIKQTHRHASTQGINTMGRRVTFHQIRPMHVPGPSLPMCLLRARCSPPSGSSLDADTQTTSRRSSTQDTETTQQRGKRISRHVPGTCRLQSLGACPGGRAKVVMGQAGGMPVASTKAATQTHKAQQHGKVQGTPFRHCAFRHGSGSSPAACRARAG